LPTLEPRFVFCINTLGRQSFPVITVGQNREFAQEETATQLAQSDFFAPCGFADR
jgi:hypothetical protein